MPIKNKIKNKNSGFTLVELLLYITIASVIVGVVSSFLMMILSSQVKNQAVAEVEQNGRRATRLIAQAIRNSTNINSPAISAATSSSLSLQMADASKNPTIFNTSNGYIFITEGTSTTLNITSPRTVVSNLIFTNMTGKKEKGVIDFNFILDHYNPGNRNEFSYEQTFQGEGNIR
jgi:Tfp pilus assembly protein PilW